MNEWITIAIFVTNGFILLIMTLTGFVVRNFKENIKESISNVKISAKEGIKEAKDTAMQARDMAISQEQRIITIEDALKKLATTESVNNVSSKIDMFYKLIEEKGNLLINKHVDSETEWRKSVISANASAERLQKQLKDLEQENDKLKKQK